MNTLTLNAADLHVGEWAVEPLLTRIVRDGKHTSVQPLSMDILVYLAERAGEVVTTTELLELFWADRYVGTDAVHRRIADLRRALEDDRKKPRYIETIRKRGYRLIAEVRCAEAPVQTLPVEQIFDALADREGLRLEFELANGKRIFVRGTLSLSASDATSEAREVSGRLPAQATRPTQRNGY